jgi:hypothetical protein
MPSLGAREGMWWRANFTLVFAIDLFHTEDMASRGRLSLLSSLQSFDTKRSERLTGYQMTSSELVISLQKTMS